MSYKHHYAKLNIADETLTARLRTSCSRISDAAKLARDAWYDATLGKPSPPTSREIDDTFGVTEVDPEDIWCKCHLQANGSTGSVSDRYLALSPATIADLSEAAEAEAARYEAAVQNYLLRVAEHDAKSLAEIAPDLARLLGAEYAADRLHAAADAIG